MIKELLNYIQNKQEDTFFLTLRIIPKANKTDIVEKLEDGSWKMRVKAVPEKGRANLEIEKFLKKAFSLKDVEIVGGKTSRIKSIRLVKF
ncbi:DUF167 domain-containing protein [Candidatus Peregrinibacteria bacterium]|jgi:uncharacterized protein|nr:DUF167 domain-containing protein [Candidatus Peregrinibacteria bacterium]